MMRKSISILLFLVVSSVCYADTLLVNLGFFTSESATYEDHFYERNLDQNPIGSGWTISFSGAIMPGASYIDLINTTDKAWRIQNQPVNTGFGIVFDLSPVSNTTEILLLVKREVVLTTGAILRLNGDDGYAVSLGGTTNLTIFEIRDGLSYWLLPSDAHGISDIIGKWIWLRANMTSNVISAKAWEYGESEPGNWQAQRTITTPVVASGNAGILHMGASGSNNTWYRYYAVGINGNSPSVPDIPTPPQTEEGIELYVDNNKYWQYNGEPIILIGGSEDDNLFNNIVLNIASHLDLLAANGGNYIRNTMSSRDTGNVQPHALSGSLYNLNTWNNTYWTRLENLFALAQARDIIVQIELWDLWDTVYEGWDASSWNPKNNSNYTAASSGMAESYNVHPNNLPNPFLKTVPAYQNNTVVLPYQQAFVNKFMSIALNYPNVLYNINNETTEISLWSDYWAQYIRDIATASGKTIYITDMKGSWDIRTPAHVDVINKRSLYDFAEFSQNTQNTGQTVYDRFTYMWDTYLNSAKRPMNVVKIYGGNREDLPGNPEYAGGPIEGRKKLWRAIFAGVSAVRFHRSSAGAGLSAEAQVQIKSARMLVDEIDIFNCVPNNALLTSRGTDEAYALDGDSEYAIYFPDGGVVGITLPNGLYSMQTLNIMNNSWGTLSEVTVSTGSMSVSAGLGPYAVVIKYIGEEPPSPVGDFTETHYVTQSGSGTKTGRSISNAWALTDFHNTSNWTTSKSVDSKIGPADVVYFSGTVTDRVIVTRGGSSLGSVTLDGYQAGNCDPLNAVCSGSALLQRGMSVGNLTSGPDYLTIQDFRMTHPTATSESTLQIFGNTSSSVEGDRWIDYCLIRRNYLYAAGLTNFYIHHGRYHIITDNKIFGFGLTSRSNLVAWNSIAFKMLKNSLFSRNEIGHSETIYPTYGNAKHLICLHGCVDLLIEKNSWYGSPGRAAIRPKEDVSPMQNLVIRFNKIYNNGLLDSPESRQFASAINPHVGIGETLSNIYIYGNNMYSNRANGVEIGLGINNAYVWSNIITDNGRNGIIVWDASSGLHFYNNTIARNNTQNDTELSRGGITISTGSNVYIKNNLLWNNRPAGESLRSQIYGGPIESLEHNSYFHSLGNPTVYYSGGYRTLATLQSTFGFEDDSPVGAIYDPSFVDPNGADNVFGTADDNYKLNSGSQVINTGKTLTGSFSINLSGGDSWFQTQTGYSTLSFGLDDCLDPSSTNWAANPPTAATVKQGSYGAWERGAYLYR